MAAGDELIVVYGDRTVATLPVESGRLRLVYEPSWLSSQDAFPVSLSLPLREAPHAEIAHAFFTNLLPEGPVRQAVCARLGISVDNDVGLLRAIGGECAGALSIVERSSHSRSRDDHAYEEITPKRMQQLVDRDDLVPLLLGGPPTRLSLAGAQDKLPVAVFDGRVHLPLAGAPSTHVLKLPHARFAHVPLNEMFVMGLASYAGLSTASTTLVLETDPPCLLSERYDRRVSDDGATVARRHQEDMCQALGYPATQKYEQEGGPSLVRILELVRDHSQQPAIDVRRLIEWQAFNVVAGNCDGHAKNLSLLYEQRAPRLSPFYDMLSTRHYPALDQQLAMAVGGRRKPSELHREQWQALAREAGIGTRVVLELALAVAEHCLDAIPAWTKEYRERFGRRAILQTLPGAIARSARRVKRQLTS